MSLRIVVVTSVLVLYGLVTILPASGLRCNVKECTYFPDEEPICEGSGIVDCLEEGDDRCGIFSVTLGSSYCFTIWNCTQTTFDDCNEQKACSDMRKMANAIEDTLESCSVTCCDTDECNVPDKKKHDKEIETITKKFHWPFH